jgi:8-oxo-dGTP pyrophosphatase MutT (NUDIX family)
MSRMEPLSFPPLPASQREQVAALPWRKGATGIEILLVTSRGTGRWVIPKGWIENGDNEPSLAAAREAQEEAGLVGVPAKSGLGFYSYAKQFDDGTSADVRVRVYPLKVIRQLKHFKEVGERHLEWFAAVDAAAAVKEPDLAALIASFSEQQDGRKR